VRLLWLTETGFVMTPNEAKSTESVLTCLQADLTPVGMRVHDQTAECGYTLGKLERGEYVTSRRDKADRHSREKCEINVMLVLPIPRRSIPSRT
jgi:hypothetical protein